MVRKKYNITKNDLSWEKYNSCSGSDLPGNHHHHLTTTLSNNRKQGNDYSKRQIWLLIIPLLDVTIVNSSLISCYIIGLFKGQVQPLPSIPYISDLGRTQPQSYIFSFGMASTSFTTFLIVFFRYKQVSFARQGCVNIFSAVLGGLAAISKLVLGCFQYHDDWKWLHYAAFISYIFFSYLFLASQVTLTHHNKTPSSTATLFARLVLALLMIVFGALFCTFMLPTLKHMNCPPYNVAQIAQWIYWTLLNMYIITFLRDFIWIRVSWNVRNYSKVQEITIAEHAGFLSNSHEMTSVNGGSNLGPWDVESKRSSTHRSFNREITSTKDITTEV